MENYTFDKVARGERYFTSTILPILLTANNNAGVKNLFEKCFDHAPEEGDFELVTELDPLRDGSVYNNSVKELFKKEKRVAVPDLFLRINDKIIILEGKFFTFPSSNELEKQIEEQKRAFEMVQDCTKYENTETKFVGLTVNELSLTDPYQCITWDEMIEVVSNGNDLTSGQYFLEILQDAIGRAKDEWEEVKSKTNVTYERISFNDMRERAGELIQEGKVFVGFSEGLVALKEMNLEELKNRDHYRISSIQWSDNWIPITKVLERFIEVEYVKFSLDD